MFFNSASKTSNTMKWELKSGGQVVSRKKNQASDWLTYLVYKLEACFLAGNHLNSCPDLDLRKIFFFWKQTLINKTLARKREKLTRCFFDFRRFFCSTLIWKVRKFIIAGAWLEDYFYTKTLTQMRRATNTNIFF